MVWRKKIKRFKALGDGTRLKLLALLEVRSCCVCELAAALDLSQPTITRHLQKLTEAGFLAYERKGFFQIYRLAPEDEEAQSLLFLALAGLEEDPEIRSLKKKLTHLEAGPPWLKGPEEVRP
ncbi:MAG: ArsR family transcriptional regulator [Thermodesulfatator sp.]|nr:MAG: ArsR family transcriptional regulator [Thermodesulfatator sp.]